MLEKPNDNTGSIKVYAKAVSMCPIVLYPLLKGTTEQAE